MAHTTTTPAANQKNSFYNVIRVFLERMMNAGTTAGEEALNRAEDMSGMDTMPFNGIL